MKINLVQRVLDRSQTLARLGLYPQAAALYRRLASFRDLPADVAEDTQKHLAEIHLARGRYKLARRCLSAALSHRPDEPHYHYLMGVAVNDDPKGDPRRALKHFKAALTLDADHPGYQAEFGLLALDCGLVAAGLRAVRRAAELSPDDAELLGRLAAGLRQAGQVDLAGKLLQAALFRHGRDQRFRQLWERHQLELIRTAQASVRRRWKLTEADGPIILKFARPRRTRVAGQTVRHDQAEAKTGPKLLGQRRRSPRGAK